MRLHWESWDAEATGWDETACAASPLAIDGGQAPHAEDTFLADFARFACARERATKAIAVELARAALDAIEDIDGVWQALRVEAWLDALAAERLTIEDLELAALARAFVEWLVDRGRLSLHGQRLLARRIARWRRRAQSAPALAA